MQNEFIPCEFGKVYTLKLNNLKLKNRNRRVNVVEKSINFE